MIYTKKLSRYFTYVTLINREEFDKYVHILNMAYLKKNITFFWIKGKQYLTEEIFVIMNERPNGEVNIFCYSNAIYITNQPS